MGASSNKLFWFVCRQILGTWRTEAICEQGDLIKIDNRGIDPLVAATVSVNPCSAYAMLQDYVQLQRGDCIIQNGANSAVGQAVIQLAANRGIQTINVIRNRPDFKSLETYLRGLGATFVVTEEDLRRASGLPVPSLGLNCVGGKSATNIARILGY